jgi:molybdenum cofactor cytidylyltransferase
MSEVVSIILAAGKGERLGGPKALLLWPSTAQRGRTELPLAIAHAEARLEAESSRVLVVTRRPVFKALLAYIRPGIDLLSSDMPDDLGPAGSIAFGAARTGDAPYVLITPVDTPPARSDTTARLLDRLCGPGAGDPPPLAVRPRYGERAGHPVILRAEALAPYRKPQPPALRDHLRTLGARCVDVEVDDSAVRLDLNTPADIMGALRAPPRFLST